MGEITSSDPRVYTLAWAEQGNRQSLCRFHSAVWPSPLLSSFAETWFHGSKRTENWAIILGAGDMKIMCSEVRGPFPSLLACICSNCICSTLIKYLVCIFRCEMHHNLHAMGTFKNKRKCLSKWWKCAQSNVLLFHITNSGEEYPLASCQTILM